MNPKPGKHNDNPVNAHFIGTGIKFMQEAMRQRAVMMRRLGTELSYSIDAYIFVMDALHYTLKKLKVHGHINGAELSEGIRQYALRIYGPMSRTVLLHWNIKTTMDFGEIVFALVEAGFMRARDEDSKEDFRDVYDFEDAFSMPYKRCLAPQKGMRRRRKN